MAGQIKALLRLELCNLYGLNAVRFSCDKRVKGRNLLLLAVWAVLLLLAAGYVGGLSYGLVFLGMERVVPVYLLVLSSLLPFVLNVFTAGSVLFRREGYDILCSLPVAKGAIVLSRLVRMYVEQLLLAWALLLPGLAVYLWNVRLEPIGYLLLFFSIWFVPFLPMAGAAFIGTLVSGLASRMRHKSLAVSGLTILMVFGVFYGISRLTALEDGISLERWKEFSEILSTLLGRLYPPAVWFGKAAAEGKAGWGLLYIGSSVLALGITAGLVTICFHPISQRLYGSLARHHYRLGKQQESTLLAALCKRELRRYVSSSVYVSNTIIGPLMGCLLSGGLLAAGPGILAGSLPAMVSERLSGLLPFVLAIPFATMPITSVSISMEGKHWWIIQSLPVPFQTVLDAKVLFNMLVAAPFYVVSELLAVIALRPSLPELFWLLIIPLVFLLFASVFGLTVNLRFPVLEWENEASVVKQSVSSLLGGLGGLVAAVVCLAAAALIPEGYGNLVKTGLCLLVIFLTGWMYQKNRHTCLSL